MVFQTGAIKHILTGHNNNTVLGSASQVVCGGPLWLLPILTRVHNLLILTFYCLTPELNTESLVPGTGTLTAPPYWCCGKVETKAPGGVELHPVAGVKKDTEFVSLGLIIGLLGPEAGIVTAAPPCWGCCKVWLTCEGPLRKGLKWYNLRPTQSAFKKWVPVNLLLIQV